MLRRLAGGGSADRRRGTPTNSVAAPSPIRFDAISPIRPTASFLSDRPLSHEEEDAASPLRIERAATTATVVEGHGGEEEEVEDNEEQARKEYRLPVDHGALQAAFEASLARLPRAELLLRLDALIRVSGEDASALSAATSFFFQQMLSELEQFSRNQHAVRNQALREAIGLGLNPTSLRAEPGTTDYDVQAAAHLHQNIAAILEQSMHQSPSASGGVGNGVSNNHLYQNNNNNTSIFGEHSHVASAARLLRANRRSLGRQDSVMAIGVKWTDSASLLAHGVETYISAIRKLLRHDAIGSSVQVVLKDYNFDAFPSAVGGDGAADHVETYDTLGDRCVMTVGVLIGVWIPALLCFLGRSLYVACVRVCRRKGHHVHVEGDAATRGERDEEAQFIEEQEQQDSDASRVRVLKNVSLMIRPGRLTLVLGPPGSGRTSLLKAIAGQLLKTPGKTETRGVLAYNGRSASKLKLANWVAYASQSDDHMPLLTVRETLTHAFQCRKEIRYTDPKLMEIVRSRFGDDAVERLSAFRDIDVDVALAVLGLTECANTIIGNETLKGVSGGERRRVTMGEMLVTGTPVLCLDEISTGLDSAATFDITQYLRLTANFLEQTILVALLQPPPDVIALFDDVIVMAEGYIIYHGERTHVLEYFEGLGFKCPARKELGDFIQELPTPQGRQFRVPGAHPPSTPKEFAAKWRASSLFRDEDAAIRVHLSAEQAHEEAQAEARRGPTASDFAAERDFIDFNEMPENAWSTQLRLAIQWSWRNRLKDKIKIKAKIVQNLFMGALFGSIFFMIPYDEAYQKNMLLFNVVMFSAQTAVPEVQNTLKARAIYHKHIDQGFYRAWMLSLANVLTTIPFALLDVLIYGNLIYWMCGMSRHATAYALYSAISLLYGMAMLSIMGVFPYIVKDENRATISAVMVFIVSILVSGVIATEGVIPFYLIPLFRVNPLAWAFRALANVEFLSPNEHYDATPCVVKLNGKRISVPQRCGDFFLGSREIASGWIYVWEAFAVLLGYLVFFWCVSTLFLTYVRFEPARGVQRPAPKEEEEEEASEEEGREVPGGLTQPLLARQASLLPHENMTLVVKGLGYSIASPHNRSQRIDLLSDINMWAKHGRLTALMGSSGAGKTTLLDVLAGLKTVGTTRGEIFLDGKRMSRAAFTRVAGYVQQFGVHSPKSTIREALEFSAALRLPRDALPTREERKRHVDLNLDLLELTTLQSQLCGACSMEQNKRLTLGVELVANPSVLFADEPTSGLDARAAGIVMRVLQRVARSGRIVIATIHQPSTQIFQQFDDLLLLKKGGKVVYFGEIGPEAKKLIAYFEAIPGTTKCPDGANPAAWMLNVIGGGTGVRSGASIPVHANTSVHPTLLSEHPHISPLAGAAVEDARSSDEDEDEDSNASEDEYTVFKCRLGPCETRCRGRKQNVVAPLPDPEPDESLGLDFARVYARSELKRQNDARVASNEFGASPEISTAQATQSVWRRTRTSFHSSALTQVRWVLHRNMLELWRSPDFTFVRFVVVVFLSLGFVALFFQQEILNVPDAQSRILCVSFSCSLIGMFSMMTVMPYTMNRRALFYRERGAGMYSASVFSFAAGVSELPYLLAMAAITVNITYWGIGLNPKTNVYLYYFGFGFVYLLFFCYAGMFFASIMPEPLTAQLAGGAFFSIMNVFAGITVPASLLPKYYLWVHYVSPLRWFFEGVLSTQFHGDDRIICNPTGHPVKSGLLKGLCTSTGAADLKQLTGVQVRLDQFVLGEFLEGFEYENRYLDVAVIFAWIVAFRYLATMAAIYVSFDRR